MDDLSAREQVLVRATEEKADNDENLEKLIEWARDHNFSTGHADTQEELLGELSWQIKEFGLEEEDEEF